MAGHLAASAGGESGVASIRPPCLVGREAETSQLAAALARAGTLVLVEGEAGIGKSRLVREFLASQDAREHRSLIAACPPVHQPFTLGPLVDALRQAADGATVEITSWASDYSLVTDTHGRYGLWLDKSNNHSPDRLAERMDAPGTKGEDRRRTDHHSQSHPAARPVM